MSDEEEKVESHEAPRTDSKGQTTPTPTEPTSDRENVGGEGSEEASENPLMNPNRRWKREELYEERFKRWK